MKLPVYTKEGQKKGEVAVPAEVFGVEANQDLLHQAAVYYENRKRQPIAHTKGRGEVSGGGRKPWRQKGTGRARHGSTRSPIWIGGGVSFGPLSARVFAGKLNKKMRRKAVLAAISAKAAQDRFLVIEDAALEGKKTKGVERVLAKLPSSRERTLLVLPEMNYDIIRALRNLPFVQTIQARDLNAFDVLRARYLVASASAIEIIGKTFMNTGTPAE